MKNLAYLLIFCLWVSCSPKVPEKNPMESMIHRLDSSLNLDILNYWYPSIIDSVDGGYLSTYSAKWEPDSNQEKSVVYVARHIWTTSYLHEFRPEKKEYLDYAGHGYRFLRDYLWDKEYGGFYISVDKKGNPLPANQHEKRVYGQAFGIYGLAQYYKVSKNEEVLQFAQKAFNWIEKNAHDPVNGGYFEFLMRDGRPVLKKDQHDSKMSDRVVTGYKDYNSSIHLLEALTTLYQVWDDSLVHARLDEMYTLVSRTMVNPRGHLKLYFTPEWKNVSEEDLNTGSGGNLWYTEHITFGHDIETSFLLFEAAEVLDKEKEKTELDLIKKLTDHTLLYGWDSLQGGVYDKGKYMPDGTVRIIDDHKCWWGQAEALNSLLLMAVLFPEEKEKYYSYFEKQWNYIDRYMIDHQYGEWYSYGTDTYPENTRYNKAHPWKAAYHNTRSLVNSIKNLQKLKSGASH